MTLVFQFFHPQIAVDYGFGGVYGHQKADWMVDVIQQYFHDNGENIHRLSPPMEMSSYKSVICKSRVCVCVCWSSDDLQQYEVEDFIAQLMDQEFDTVVDDGSLPQVCTQTGRSSRQRKLCHLTRRTFCPQVSGSLLQIFGQYQQGALQQLKHTVDALSQKMGQRAEVTAPPADLEEERDAETQVCHHYH